MRIEHILMCMRTGAPTAVVVLGGDEPGHALSDKLWDAAGLDRGDFLLGRSRRRIWCGRRVVCRRVHRRIRSRFVSGRRLRFPIG